MKRSRILALILAFTLVFTQMLPTVVFAAEVNGEQQETSEEANDLAAAEAAAAEEAARQAAAEEAARQAAEEAARKADAEAEAQRAAAQQQEAVPQEPEPVPVPQEQEVEAQPICYTVEFDSDGGSAVPLQSILAGDAAVKPADPTKDGSVFSGWLLNGVLYNFDSPVSDNLTLVASWINPLPQEPEPELVPEEPAEAEPVEEKPAAEDLSEQKRGLPVAEEEEEEQIRKSPGDNEPSAVEEEPTRETPDLEPPRANVEQVSDLGSANINGEIYALDAGYKFSFPEGVPTEAQMEEYGRWYCDFFVSVDQVIYEGSGGLYGSYGGYEVSFYSTTLQPGQEIALVRAAVPNQDTLNLKDIVNRVGEFKCGVFNLSPDNVGKTFRVELRIWNPDDPTQQYTCAEKSYTFESIPYPTAVITELEALGPAAIDGQVYPLDAKYQFSFALDEPNKKQLAAYGNWYCDFFASVDSNVAANTMGLYGEYGT
ncbi:MAG: InlB B-repeat-containing protein, partial [Firmicutes bacterium]|nr:InlB B-repeat-containing protein [Bacillota bacterium]